MNTIIVPTKVLREVEKDEGIIFLWVRDIGGQKEVKTKSDYLYYRLWNKLAEEQNVLKV